MNGFTLKIIAVVSMLTDHIGAVLLLPLADNGEFVALYFITRYIGRIAFPIFAYLIAQGCIHTSSMTKYLARLGILAIIAEIPYDLAFGNEINFFAGTNVFYTLFLGAAAIAIYRALSAETDKIHWRALFAILALPTALLANYISSDFGTFGVIFIFAIYAINPQTKMRRALLVAAGMIIFYMAHPLPFIVFSLISAICIYFYNNKPGPKHPVAKYSFYAFYPLHLGILSLL
ncbi:MAG: conjugal transfer protein TraX [Clostridiales bacterium]|jgi:hypothetical protein|nr:conjugal transfer protein TraX [Clostridiales bacterium]